MSTVLVIMNETAFLLMFSVPSFPHIYLFIYLFIYNGLPLIFSNSQSTSIWMFSSINGLTLMTVLLNF